MSQLLVRCGSLLLLGISVCFAQNDSLIPPPKLRPADPSRFYPELVRLHDQDINEIRSILGHDLNRQDLAAVVTKQLLRKLPMDGNFFARFLTASSDAVQEWALRTMGGYSGDKTAAVPGLLAIAIDGRQPDAHRALAIRVLGAAGPGADSVSLLVHQLPGASRELRVILLEVIATSGRAGVAFVPELKRYLDAPEASAQFHAFRAIQQIDGDSAGGDEHYGNARRLRRAEPDASLAVRVLEQTNTPKYLTCVALFNLAATQHPQATRVLLRKVGDNDEFISQLAANVLKRMGSDAREAPALIAGLSSTNANIRVRSMLQLRELGSRAAGATDALIAALQRAGNEGASAREVGAALDLLRGIGTNAHHSSDTLVQLLDEQSPIYRQLEKHDVYRLRGFLLATLAETGVPQTALPFIMGALANSNPQSAIEFAGAARAAAALGAQAREAVPFLLRALTERLDEDFISFARFDAHGAAAGEYTICQVEALRALRQIGVADEAGLRVVRAFLEQPRLTLDGTNLFRRIPNVRAEAAQTLAAIEVNDADKN